MASKRILGLVSIKIGAIAGDGGMSIALTAIGDTVKDSCVFGEGDPTKQEFFVEESDDPIESFVTQKGTETISWSTNNLHPDIMVLLFGGTKAGLGTQASPFTWEPPDTQDELERSVEITDRKGNKMEIVRVKFSPKKSFSFQGTKLGQLDITGTILLPTKANTRKYKITYAV